MNSYKPYNNGLIIGRFQPFHKGHKKIIDEALKVCNNVYIFIGSAQESRTPENPFTFMERYEFIKDTYYCNEEAKNRLTILPLDDAGLGDTKEWGQYVYKKLLSLAEVSPNIIIQGNEDKYSKWFSYLNIPILFINRDQISSSLLRTASFSDTINNKSHYIPDAMTSKIPMMDKIIKESNGVKVQ